MAAVAVNGGKRLKRHTTHMLAPADGFTLKADTPQWILDTVGFKTAWHLIGL
jgi:hypothetical protein